jgi:outer membrane protein
LVDRAKIGRSRKSEVYLAEASIAQLEAQVEQAKGLLDIQKELLTFLSAVPEKELSVQSIELTASKVAILPLDAYLSTIRDRPDLKAFELRYRAADEGVAGAWGALLPQADLNANYYFLRAGVQQAVRWDVQLLISVPIFDGLGVYADLKTARVNRVRAELAESQAHRDAEREVRALHHQLEASQRQLLSLERARTQSGINFEEVTREYRLGLVTNLEVVQALSQYKESERAWDRLRYGIETDLIRLKVASGQGVAQ